MLNNKVRADFLVNMKTNIQMRMNEIPMTMTYESVLSNYCNTVSTKFPDDPSAHKKNRKIQSTIKSTNKGNFTKFHNGKGFKRGADSNKDNKNHQTHKDA